MTTLNFEIVNGLKSVTLNGIKMTATVEMLKKTGLFSEIDAEFSPSEADISFEINKNEENGKELSEENVNLKALLSLSKSM